MAYTKYIGGRAKVLIDGTDVSNSFDDFHFSEERTEEDGTGFSATGVKESLPGPNDQQFTGQMIVTEEISAIVEPLVRNGTACTISYQPNGLLDATREIYSGSCYIYRFESADTVGSVGKVPFLAKPATSTGITVSDWT